MFNCYELKLFANVQKMMKVYGINKNILYKINSYNLNLGIDHIYNNNTCNTIFIGNTKINIVIEHLRHFSKFKNSFQNLKFDDKSNVSSCFDDTFNDKFILKILVFECKLNQKEKIKDKIEIDVDTDLNVKFPILIGKKDCHINIQEDKEISKVHFLIKYDSINKIFSIHDENSKNGTWLLVKDNLFFNLKCKEKKSDKLEKNNNKNDKFILSNLSNSFNSKDLNVIEIIKFDDSYIGIELEKI